MKNVLIIGGSSGIGSALAKDIISEYNVYATYNTNECHNGNVTWSQFDTSTEFNTDWLPDQLDALVYCPGRIDLKPFKRIKRQSIIEDFEVQVLGLVEVLQKCLPLLTTGGLSSVVAFSTVAVGRGFTFHSQVSMSKGAIEGLIKTLAAEYAPKVRFNCIAPSLTDTPLAAKLLNTEQKILANGERHPMKRIGDPIDIANAVKFLISNESSWMTGETLHIDGGMHSIK